jgi:hypothetical protein
MSRNTPRRSVVYIPHHKMCVALTDIRQNSPTTSICRQLGQDALSVFETLRVPSEHLCAVELECCARSSVDETRVARCAQIFFFDARLPTSTLLFAAQRAVVLSHSADTNHRSLFLQHTTPDKAVHCVCAAKQCRGTTTSSCVLAGAEMNDDARFVLGAINSESHQYYSAPVVRACVAQRIEPTWRFFASAQSSASVDLLPLLSGVHSKAAPRAPIDKGYTLEVLRSSNHRSNLCALDFRVGSVQFESALADKLQTTGAAAALEALVRNTLRLCGSDPLRHPSAQCNCLVEHYIAERCTSAVYVHATPLPSAPLCTRLFGDQVLSIHSPAMRELFVTQTARRLNSQINRTGAAKEAARIVVVPTATPGSANHYDTVLHQNKQIKALAREAFGEAPEKRSTQGKQVAAVVATASVLTAQRAWLQSHAGALEHLHRLFCVEPGRFETLGQLAISLGYANGTTTERTHKTSHWLPPPALLCVREAEARVARHINCAFVPFSVACEANLLRDICQTDNRRLVMARITTCLLSGASVDEFSNDKSALMTIAATAILLMIDDALQLTQLCTTAAGAAAATATAVSTRSHTSTGSLQSYMRRELDIDFFDLSQWWCTAVISQS